MNAEPKKLWHSKTIIFNCLVIVSAGLAAAISNDLFSDSQLKWIIVLQSMANIALRLITDKPVTVTNP